MGLNNVMLKKILTTSAFTTMTSEPHKQDVLNMIRLGLYPHHQFHFADYNTCNLI